MCRWIAYSGAPLPLDHFLFRPQYSLVEQSIHARKGLTPVNGDGFGVGWYGGLEIPGLFRDVLPAWSDENLKSLARQVESRMFLAHVRASTGTATMRTNCHPFAHRNLLFMHNGQVGEFARVRRRLEQMLPDGLYRERLGTTDSEVLFLLLVSFGVEADARSAIRRLIDTVTETMGAAGIEEAFRFTCALADGQSIRVVRHSSDPHPPTVYYRERAGGCVIVSEPLDSGIEQRWNELPPEHLLTLAGPGEARIETL